MLSDLKQGKLWFFRYSNHDEQTAVSSGRTTVRFRVEAEFEHMKDEARFFYYDEDRAVFVQMGKTHRLYFDLDHFTGCRFGLFLFASKQTGGRVSFRDFVYE